MALSDNLVAYYKLDESSGNPADSVGSNTLTNNGTVTFGTGKINNGADFGSANSTKYFSTGADTIGSTIGTGDFSFSFWYNPSAQPGTNVTFEIIGCATGNPEKDYRVQYVDVSGTKKINFNRGNYGGTDANAVYSTTLSTGTWYHIVATYSSGSNLITLYLNGTSVATASTVTNGFGGGSNRYFNVGAWVTPTNYNSGKVDEVGVWTRTLTSGEVTTLYNGGAGKAYPYGTAYSLVLSLGTYTYTGFDTLFTRALQMIISVGTYTYTGFDTILKRGMGIVMGVGTYTYTGFDTILTKALTMALAIGTYTYTGFDTALSKGFNLVAQAGSYVYTGFNVLLRKIGWDKASKSNTTSWSNRSKSNTSSWTNQTK